MILTKDFLRGAAEGRVSMKDGGGIPMPRETAAKENPVSQQKTPASAGGIQDQMAYQVFAQPDSPGAALGTAIGNAAAQWLKNNPDWYKGWLQKGAFEDGYQFGDVTKTAVATGRDLGGNLLTGVAGIGEKAVDALAYAAPYIAQGQYYQNGGVYQPLEFQKAQNQAFEQNKKLVADFIAKDLYDERAVADTILQNSAFERETGINIRKNSVMGDKADALAQSGGQLLGTAGLKLLGIPAELTIFATSFGGEAENALNQGASMEEAGISAAISAGTELLTEKFSDGIKLIGGKTITEAMKKKLARAISNKTVRTLIGLGLDTVGEGFEEVTAEVVHAVGQKLTYASEKEMKELLTRESLWDAFIGGIIMGNVSVTAKAATGNYRTGWDGREAVVEATGPSITVDGKKYQLLGYDAKGVPVYEDARKVQEQEAAKAGTQRGASGVVQEQPTAEVHNQAEKEESKNLYDHTAVDPFVKTAKYRRLYNYLEENTGIQRTAYERAKAMLHHRSGTKFEDLTYINTITGEQITRSDYNVENEVMPSRRMREMVQKSEPYTIVSLHNHAGSSVPSIADIQSAYKQKYKYGLIVCHNGMLMRYRVTDEYNYIVVQSLLDKAQKYLYNNDELALQRVLSDLKEANVLLEVFK